MTYRHHGSIQAREDWSHLAGRRHSRTDNLHFQVWLLRTLSHQDSEDRKAQKCSPEWSRCDSLLELEGPANAMILLEELHIGCLGVISGIS